MVRRSGRFGRFAATTNTQVAKEMALQTSPFNAASIEYSQQMKRSTVERRKEKNISILVQILTGRRIYLTVDPKHCTLLDVKKKIQSKEGIHPDQQILLWNGERLKDGSLKDLKIVDGSNFFLTLRNRGG